MERQELVKGIKETFQVVTETLVSAMNELRASVNDRVSQIKGLRDGLREDNVAMTDIAVAIQDFSADIEEIGEEMSNVSSVVDDILYDLDKIYE